MHLKKLNIHRPLVTKYTAYITQNLFLLFRSDFDAVSSLNYVVGVERKSDFNEFAPFHLLFRCQKHVDFTNERSGLNDSDLLIEAFHLDCFNAGRTCKKPMKYT